jgi:hypothetical protein
MAEPTKELFEMWKRQLEEGTQAWLKLLGQSAPSAMDPGAFWKPFMDQSMAAWSRMMTQGTPPSPDLMAQWKQFIDHWIAAWAKALEQAMSTEAFAHVMGKQLETYLNVANPVKKAAEQHIEATLSGLGLPSRSQVVALARHLVQLEEKLEAIEDRLGAVQRRLDQRDSPAKGESS